MFPRIVDTLASSRGSTTRSAAGDFANEDDGWSKAARSKKNAKTAPTRGRTISGLMPLFFKRFPIGGRKGNVPEARSGRGKFYRNQEILLAFDRSARHFAH